MDISLVDTNNEERTNKEIEYNNETLQQKDK